VKAVCTVQSMTGTVENIRWVEGPRQLRHMQKITVCLVRCLLHLSLVLSVSGRSVCTLC